MDQLRPNPPKKTPGIKQKPNADGVKQTMQPQEVFEEEEEGSQKKVCHYVLIFITVLLVITAIVGPVYAFTVVSCFSTSSCRIVGVLGVSGAFCTEGPGARSEYLMHGEQCTVQCQPGLVPSTPVLQCDDGVTIGAEDFACAPPVPSVQRGNLLGGLIDGAITGGEVQTACRRATNLKCKGTPGGTAILMQLTGINYFKCKELLDECRETNGEFEWMQFEVDSTIPTEPPVSEFAPREPPVGYCSLGCWIERPESAAPLPTAAPIIGSQIKATEVIPAGASLCGGPLTPEVPICVAVHGSCNAADNGDYYRIESCAAFQPQWVMPNHTRRIRYDGRPTTGQGGKWILEGGIDPSLNTYGELSARQDTFRLLPNFGVQPWSFECKDVIDVFTTRISYSVAPLILGSCSCTRLQDCSGHGRAKGEKTYGPNCGCICDEGWTGTKCDKPLCKAPQIFRAQVQACAEGDWIHAGEKCTAQCEDGYRPTVDFITCLPDAVAFTPPLFYCDKKNGGADLAAQASSMFAGTTAAPRACMEIDCSFRGTPTGERRVGGSCVCECLPNYIGWDCRTYAGECPAPLRVENAATQICAEGTTVSTVCTPQCLPGYWPVPEQLQCTAGSNKLFPEAFKCYGGPAAKDEWCQLMQYCSIAASILSVLTLLVICVYEAPILRRKPAAFVLGDSQLIDLHQDDDGNSHYIVRSEGKDTRSHLPHRLKECYINAPLQTGTNHVEATLDPRYKEDAEYMIENRKEVTLTIGDGELSPSAVNPETTLRAVAFEADDESCPESLATGEAEFGGYLAIDLPGSIPPEEPVVVHMDWHLQYHALDEECQRKRYEEAHDSAAANVSQEQRAAIEREERIRQAVEDTTQERSDAEDAMQSALARGDGEALREACLATKAVLAKLEGAPASITNMLVRISKIGEGRYEQYYEHMDKKANHAKYLDRIKTGKAGDWHMSVDELWRYVESGNLAAVNAGLKAKLPVLVRSSDGKRSTLLHMACKPACMEAVKAVTAAATAARAAKVRAATAEVAAAEAAAAQAAAAAGADAAGGVGTGGGAEAGAGIGPSSIETGATETTKDAQFGAEEEAGQTIFEEDTAAAAPSADDAEDFSMAPTPEEAEQERLAVESSRLGIVKALIEARASPNTLDGSDRTPLDLAVSEGGLGAEDLPIVKMLRDAGLLTATEAAEMVIQEAVARAREAGGSRLTGKSTGPKAKSKPPNPAARNRR